MMFGVHPGEAVSGGFASGLLLPTAPAQEKAATGNTSGGGRSNALVGGK